MDAEGGVVVFVVVALHGADDADVVHAFPEVGEEVANHGAALAAGSELPAGFEEDALLVGEAAADAGFLAVGAVEFGFVVERVHVGDAAI